MRSAAAVMATTTTSPAVAIARRRGSEGTPVAIPVRTNAAVAIAAAPTPKAAPSEFATTSVISAPPAPVAPCTLSMSIVRPTRPPSVRNGRPVTHVHAMPAGTKSATFNRNWLLPSRSPSARRSQPDVVHARTLVGRKPKRKPSRSRVSDTHPAIDPKAANHATVPCGVSRVRVNHRAPTAASASRTTTAINAEALAFDETSRLASPAIVSTR